MKVSTPLGIGYIISPVNDAGEVVVKLCERDNVEWIYNGAYIFRMMSMDELEVME